MLRQLSVLALLISLLFGLLTKTRSQGANLLDLRSERVLLLTAHPDDECMFFAPTLLALAQDYHVRQAEELTSSVIEDDINKGPPVFSLCMSVGNADGLGFTRRDELQQSLNVLGVSKEKSWVVDHPQLQDNFTAIWDSHIIADTIRPFITDNAITIVLTFDGGGVSGHPNHISLPNGVKHLIETTPALSDLRLYTLVTVPLWSKYTGILGPALSALRMPQSVASILQLIGFQSRFMLKNFGDPDGTPEPPKMIFISHISNYVRALRAMQQHSSQLVWFRWLYVTYSRYMWVNEWARIA
ncbi:LmbE-like protein [Pluteus cervinus]|uniref:LmbE-like protein n=1 Tax=Pluteus cervinus TaxID=181527 RepID=A0ACD3AQG3_9AGAR|nr:LmbE-like protein [Pluteus cervinus]